MDSARNAMSEKDIIDEANGNFDYFSTTVLSACEAFEGNGFADEVSGDVDTFYHFYRVHRWIVTTDSQGFKELETYDTEREAMDAFESHSQAYARCHET